ncbi:hypothetical protein IWQ48_005397 [Labrenzia sp. EL_13]|nr:hypothetical protein [Labrenzia sp. EL_13]
MVGKCTELERAFSDGPFWMWECPNSLTEDPQGTGPLAMMSKPIGTSVLLSASACGPR